MTADEGNVMKRWVGLLAFVTAMAVSAVGFGQEIQITGPLAGAPSCRHCVLYRSHRLSIAPTFGITLQDEFDRAMFFGAQLQFHINDLIGIGVWGAFAGVHINTALTSQVTTQLSMPGAQGTPNIPNGSHFPQQIGQMQWFLSAPQLTIVPLRGKLALFQNIFLDTDFYLFGGLAIIGVSERATYDQDMDPDGSLAASNQTMRSSRIAFTGTFGAGLNFYITHFLSLSVEYRAFPFNWNTSGTDESSAAQTCGVMSNSSCAGFPDYAVQRDNNGGGRYLINAGDQSFHFNQMINIGINVFLPFTPSVSE